MRERAKIRLRTLGWLILPVIALVVIPWLLQYRLSEPFAWHGGWGQWPHHLSSAQQADGPPSVGRQVVGWLGVWLIANGLGLAAWCVNLFNVEGRGTPLPLDPPTRFVVSGPYRFARNPMMLGTFVILWGEVAVFQSWALAMYALVIMGLAHLFVRVWEEPDLARRFGEAYLEYRRQVPRWVPRWISRKPVVRKS